MKTLFFYSTDFHGMGHFTRTVRIVNYLAQQRSYDKFIIITNKYIIKKYLQKNVELLILPEITISHKPKSARYVYYESLAHETIAWKKFLLEKLDEYKPNVFYTDLTPSGGYGELKTIFPRFKKRGIKTIIGLRDILDSPAQSKKEWFDNQIIQINQYDHIIVYGDQALFTKLYNKYLGKKQIYYPGYVIPDKKKKQKIITDILVLFGGGGKSHEQIVYLSQLLSKIKDKKIVLITGPLFSAHDRSELRKNYPTIHYRKQYNNGNLLLNSKLIISHCGYNTLLEVLISSKHVVMFPRLTTRKEQIYRAQYFKKKGYADYIDYRDSDEVNLKKIDFAFSNVTTQNVNLKQCLSADLLPLFWL